MPRRSSATAVGTAPAIELEGLGRRLGGRVVLRDLTLAVPAGATLAVLGANGAGKSTLLRVLAGLLRPHAGTVRVLGHALPEEGFAVRGRVGLLAHEPLLYRDLTVRQNLQYHARLHGVPARRVEAVLDAVDLVARADDPVAELSRGLVQRAAVARAVLHDPAVLLLDEPYANLDPAAVARLAPLLAGARTRVLTSHDPAAALREADLVLGLRAGRAAFVGAPDAVDPAELYGP
jgi:ABC-type multidrug transport system ATPase subunit